MTNFISIGEFNHDTIESIKKECDNLRTFIHEIDKNVENITNTNYDQNTELTAQQTDEIKKVGLMIDLMNLFKNPSTPELLEYLQMSQRNNNSRYPSRGVSDDIYDTDPSYRRNMYHDRNNDNNDIDDTIEHFNNYNRSNYFNNFDTHHRNSHSHMDDPMLLDKFGDSDTHHTTRPYRINMFNNTDDILGDIGILENMDDMSNTDNSDASDIPFDELDYDEFISVLTSAYLNIQFKSTLVNNYSFTRSYD